MWFNLTLCKTSQYGKEKKKGSKTKVWMRTGSIHMFWTCLRPGFPFHVGKKLLQNTSNIVTG